MLIVNKYTYKAHGDTKRGKVVYFSVDKIIKIIYNKNKCSETSLKRWTVWEKKIHQELKGILNIAVN